MTRNEYNGWTNYETWLVHLHLSNDATLDASSRELAEYHSLDDGSAAGALQGFVEEHVFRDDEMPSMAVDLIRSALSEVNWQEIAKAYAEIDA